MTYRPSPSEVAAYREKGYLIIPRHIFALEKYERLKEHCQQIFEANRKPDGKMPALIDCPHWQDPQLFEWLYADEIISLVEPLIGPNIGVFACHLLQKPSATGHGVPWHEDSMYWDSMLDPVDVASVTIAFTPASPENGCLRVIAGSHRRDDDKKFCDYVDVKDPERQVFPVEIVPGQIDESKAVDIVLQPNQASIHDGRIIHGSALNTGAIGRSCLTVRYMPTTVKFRRESFPGEFHIFLARGIDQAGNDYSDPNDTNRAKRPTIGTA